MNVLRSAILDALVLGARPCAALLALASTALAQQDPVTGSDERPTTSSGVRAEAAVAVDLLGTDTVVLVGGRVVRGTVVNEAGVQYLVLPHGRLPIPPEQLAELLLDPREEYSPRDERERRSLARGYVFHDGTWMTSERRQRMIDEQRAEIETRRQEIESRLDFANAWQQESLRFTMRSNTSVGLLAEYTRALESFFDLFERRFRPPHSAIDRTYRPVVHLHRDRAGYLAAGAPPTSAGWFDSVERRLALYHDRTDPDASREVLFHEATHLLMHRLRPDYLFPIWLNEGLAEYYGATRWDPAAKRWVVGGIQWGRLVLLRREAEAGRTLSLDDLLATRPERFGSLHYAQAWALVHFLLEDDRLDSRFLGFLFQLVAGRGIEESSIEIAPGVSRRTASVEEVSRALRRQLRVRDLAELDQRVRAHWESGLPDPGPRGWTVAAKLRLRDRQLDLAEEAAQKALSLGSTDPTVHLVLARVHALRQDLDRCSAEFRRALELVPLDPDVHHEFGITLCSSPLATVDQWEEGRTHLHLAHELDPVEPRFVQAIQRFRERPDSP